MSSAQDGHGTTITFETSGYSARLIGVGGAGPTRGAIKTSTMASEDAHDYMPEDLYDGGELSLTVEHDGSDEPPIDQPAETVTIDWGGGGNSWSFSAFCTGFNATAQIGERMQGEMKLKVTGKITF